MWEACASNRAGRALPFCFPHSIWSLSPFRDMPADNIQALSRGPEPQLLVHGNHRQGMLACAPTHPRSPCTGFAALPCSLLKSSFRTRPSSGAFQQEPSAPAKRTATLTVPFTSYVSEGTLSTRHPHQPPPSPLFLKYVRPEM